FTFKPGCVGIELGYAWDDFSGIEMHMQMNPLMAPHIKQEVNQLHSISPAGRKLLTVSSGKVHKCEVAEVFLTKFYPTDQVSWSQVNMMLSPLLTISRGPGLRKNIFMIFEKLPIKHVVTF